MKLVVVIEDTPDNIALLSALVRELIPKAKTYLVSPTDEKEAIGAIILDRPKEK